MHVNIMEQIQPLWPESAKLFSSRVSRNHEFNRSDHLIRDGTILSIPWITMYQGGSQWHYLHCAFDQPLD